MSYWTDYPFTKLGDRSGELAPIRKIEVLAYDRSKYCKIRVMGIEEEIKSGYIYTKPGRVTKVPSISRNTLHSLPVYS